MTTKEDLQSKSKADLIRLIQELRARKRYGLVWEDHPESLHSDFKKLFPILTVDAERDVGKFNSERRSHMAVKGENLEVLCALQATHTQSIDVIYIDPPYNTGKGDFKYNDKIVDAQDAFRHSKWLSFMSKRLRLAKNLLKDSGVIFISIDEHEVFQLKLLCDEVLGEPCFLGNLIWLSGQGGTNDKSSNLAINNEYVLAYSARPGFKFKLAEKSLKNFQTNLKFQNAAFDGGKRDHREGTPFQLVNVNKQKDYRVTIKLANGKVVRDYPSAYPQDTIDKFHELGMLVSRTGEAFDKKSYLCDEKEGATQSNLLQDLGTTRKGNAILAECGIKAKKMYPKPVALIEHLLGMCDLPPGALVLDFFAGTGTTGDAVMRMNERGHDLRFMVVTNNEDQIYDSVCWPRLQARNMSNENIYSMVVSYVSEDFSTNLYQFFVDLVQTVELAFHRTEARDCVILRNSDSNIFVMRSYLNLKALSKIVPEDGKRNMVYFYAPSGELPLEVLGILGARGLPYSTVPTERLLSYGTSVENLDRELNT